MQINNTLTDTVQTLYNNSDMDKSSSYRWKCVGVIRQNLLVILTIIGAGLGFMIGFVCQPKHLSISELIWIGKNLTNLI